MRSSSGDREILEGLDHPRPPAGLRARTLVAARLSASAPRTAPPWQAVLAFFGMQRGWTAALAALLVAHLLLGFFNEGARPPRAALPRNAEEAAQPDLLRLPRIKDLARQIAGARLEKTHGEGGLS